MSKDGKEQIRIECSGADSLPLDAIEEFQGNLKKRGKKEIDQIITSIQRFGFSFPFFVWRGEGHNYCLDGHGRIQALAELRRKGHDLPLFPVSYIEAKDHAEAKQKLLRLNSQYGAMSVASVLEFTEGLEMDWEELALPEGTLSFKKYQEETIDDNETPDLLDDPISKLGEVYELGPHRLMCGDSTSVDAVDTLMIGDVADVIVFDPPYEIETLYADAMMPPLPHQKLLVFWDFKRFATAPASALSAGWTPCYELIWDNVTSWYTPNRPLARHKSCGVFGADPSWDFDNAIIYDGKKRETKTVYNTRGPSDYVPLNGAVHLRTVESFPTTAESSEHSHSKPMAWIVAMFNGVGGKIYLDLFGGSGTTLIACAKTGRVARVMELDPKYCDVIRRRWTKWATENGQEVGSGGLEMIEEQKDAKT